jgi:hypothetical protein
VALGDAPAIVSTVTSAAETRYGNDQRRKRQTDRVTYVLREQLRNRALTCRGFADVIPAGRYRIASTTGKVHAEHLPVLASLFSEPITQRRSNVIWLDGGTDHTGRRFKCVVKVSPAGWIHAQLYSFGKLVVHRDC